MKPLTNQNLKYRKAVFIAIYRKNPKTQAVEYIILKRKKHWIGWEFVKGGIEKGESIKSAVRREVYEETGSRPKKISRYPLSGKYKYHKMFADRPNIMGQTYTLWGAELPAERKIKIDRKEHSAYAWVDFSKAIKMLTHKNQKKCLNFVNKKLS